MREYRRGVFMGMVSRIGKGGMGCLFVGSVGASGEVHRSCVINAGSEYEKECLEIHSRAPAHKYGKNMVSNQYRITQLSKD